MKGPDVVIVENNSSYAVTVTYKGGTKDNGSISWNNSSFDPGTTGEITDAVIEGGVLLLEGYSPGDEVHMESIDGIAFFSQD
jgi:hypothetical protein